MDRIATAFPLLAALAAAACAACSSGGDAPDGSAGGDGGAAGDAGCASVKQCSTKDPADAICVRGDCRPLDKEQNYVSLNLGFTYAEEIMSSVATFTYYAIHPTLVGGGTVQCADLINGLDPEDTGINLIQEYNKQLIVSGQMMQTATLYLPYLTGMVLFARTFDGKSNVNGLACTPNVTVSAAAAEVGLTFCPADKTERCLSLLPK